CVLAWLTNCKFWMEVLRDRLDPYKAFGVHFLGKPYEDITKQERNWCKPGALGAGYRLGGGFLEIDKNGDEKKTGLWGYAESLGVKLTQAQAKRATEVYRELSPEIVNFWYDLENACIAVITDKQPRTVRGLLIDLKAPFLRIRLPSGRHLFYCRPKVETVRVKGEDGYFNTTNMTYEGVDQYTKQWSRQSTHGGKLTENIVQAIACDVLTHGFTEALDEGFDVRGHVHDEDITLCPLDDTEHTVERLCEVITRAPEWAEGLPLSAAGYEGDFYRKD
ncbi:MAG: hypothetical protein M3R16_03100, partial [Pseudomonadota bacterium]|nr:hypothetical protein [Pseudomonadota bacterium]